MKTQVVEDTTKELIDPSSNDKIKKVHNRVVGHVRLEKTISRLAQKRTSMEVHGYSCLIYSQAMRLLSKDEHPQDIYLSPPLRDIFLHTGIVVKHRLHRTFQYKKRQWLHSNYYLLFHTMD